MPRKSTIKLIIHDELTKLAKKEDDEDNEEVVIELSLQNNPFPFKLFM